MVRINQAIYLRKTKNCKCLIKYRFKGSDRKNDKNNTTDVGDFDYFHPAGVSVNQISHFVQIYNKGDEHYFAKFDYGTEENTKR
jgi:hypothetical protein